MTCQDPGRTWPVLHNVMALVLGGKHRWNEMLCLGQWPSYGEMVWGVLHFQKDPCIYIHIHKYIYNTYILYTYIYIYMYIHTCTYIYIYTHVYIYTYMYIYIDSIYVYTHKYRIFVYPKHRSHMTKFSRSNI